MKTYISVNANFDEDGNILPFEILWDDGRTYTIDRVLDVRPGFSLKAGGQGLRYTCKILNKTRLLFLEDNKWFVDKK